MDCSSESDDIVIVDSVYNKSSIASSESSGNEHMVEFDSSASEELSTRSEVEGSQASSDVSEYDAMHIDRIAAIDLQQSALNNFLKYGIMMLILPIGSMLGARALLQKFMEIDHWMSSIYGAAVAAVVVFLILTCVVHDAFVEEQQLARMTMKEKIR